MPNVTSFSVVSPEVSFRSTNEAPNSLPNQNGNFVQMNGGYGKSGVLLQVLVLYRKIADISACTSLISIG